jgi:hypothetical protein
MSATEQLAPSTIPSAVYAAAARKALAQADRYTELGDAPRMREFYLRRANRLAGMAHYQAERGL